MEITIKAKSMLASFLRLVGINSWKLGRYSNEDCAILMYHRVLPKKEQGHWVESGMVVEPDTLDLHIRYLRKHFQIVPLSALATLHYRPPRALREKPLCVLTFDDGWYDFYEYAYPILKMNEAPATVFLPTDFIGTNRWFWTDRVGRLLDRLPHSWSAIKGGSELQDPLVGQVVKMRGTQESRLERVMALLKPCRVERVERILSELTALAGEAPIPVGRAFISWEEVQEMSASGLIAFGSHTAGHPILTTLTADEARHELKKSMDSLICNKVVDPAFIPFCYPNGNFSESLSGMVQDAGYHLAVTTQYGWNHPGVNPYTLRRIAIHQDMTSTEAMLESRIVNLL
jgi:peptidoglycan/xylan/chitin deacetylase (PgdA/CDA1 family)